MRILTDSLPASTIQPAKTPQLMRKPYSKAILPHRAHIQTKKILRSMFQLAEDSTLL